MKELFTIDLQDYNNLSEYYIRPSSRAIIIKDQKVALVYSKKYDYYKFPGGGIKKSETNIEALIKKIDSKNQHYGFTIDFQIEKGNAYFVLIKGEKIIREIPHNQITTIHTDGGYEDIELRILGESCKVYINVTYGISD